MATIVAVEDAADERVGDFVLLTDPDLRRRREQSGGVDGGFFIAEGELVIRQLLRSAYQVRSLLLTPPRLASLEADLARLDVPVFVAGQELVDAISGFHLHRGALAAAERGAPRDPWTVADAADLLVVAEGLNDHENLGALFRNASAFGAGGLLLDRTSADPLYRRAVRVSMGHVLRVPFARLGGWPESLSQLRASGFEVLALTPATDALDIDSVTRRPRQALVVGAEGPGLSPAALAAADVRVRIPMAPGVDSLNVATAAAVALHRLGRVG